MSTSFYGATVETPGTGIMPSVETFEQSVADELAKLGAEFFSGKNYNQMHGRVLGVLAKAAFHNGLEVAIDLPHPLAHPFQGKNQKQWQARPDLTLYAAGPHPPLWGIVEYESMDINGSRLPYKRHLLVNWPPRIPGITSVMVAMTVPDKGYWPDSPSRSDIEQHRTSLITEAAHLDVTYSFLLVDPRAGIEAVRFTKGSTISETSYRWKA
jgi:hypothetical protein